MDKSGNLAIKQELRKARKMPYFRDSPTNNSKHKLILKGINSELKGDEIGVNMSGSHYLSKEHAIFYLKHKL